MESLPARPRDPQLLRGASETIRTSPVALILVFVTGCSGSENEKEALRAETPLHLETHLERAQLEGSNLPETSAELLEWR